MGPHSAAPLPSTQDAMPVSPDRPTDKNALITIAAAVASCIVAVLTGRRPPTC